MGKGNRNRNIRVTNDSASANNGVKLSKKQLIAKAARKAKITKYVSIFAVLAIIIGVVGGMFACKYLEKNALNRTVSGTSSKYEISNAMVAYYAHSEARYMEQYYYYYYGQTMDLTGATYKQTFMDNAKSTLEQYVALASEAHERGYKLDDEDKKSIDDAIAELENSAKAVNASLDAYLSSYFCTGVNEKTVRTCMELQSLAMKYYDDMVGEYEIGDDTIKKYFDEHPESFKQVDYLSYSFEGGVGDNATDAQKKEELEKNKKKAQEFLDGIKKNEDGSYDIQSFRDAINKIEREAAVKTAEEEAEKDATKKENLDKTKEEINKKDYSEEKESEGYLYSKDNEFATWAFEGGRKVGDVKITEGSVGCTLSILLKTEYIDDYALRNIRYILLGGEKAADDATEEKKNEAATAREEAKKKAEEVLGKYNSGEKTEDSFAALAKEHSKDTSTSESGGLYESLDKGITVPEFDAWVFDANRKQGDVEIVLSEDYGYFIIYYKGENEKLKWQEDANDLIFSEMSEADINALKSKHPVTWDAEVLAKTPYEYTSSFSASTSATA